MSDDFADDVQVDVLDMHSMVYNATKKKFIIEGTVGKFFVDINTNWKALLAFTNSDPAELLNLFYMMKDGAPDPDRSMAHEIYWSPAFREAVKGC